MASNRAQFPADETHLPARTKESFRRHVARDETHFSNPHGIIGVSRRSRREGSKDRYRSLAQSLANTGGRLPGAESKILAVPLSVFDCRSGFMPRSDILIAA